MNGCSNFKSCAVKFNCFFPERNGFKEVLGSHTRLLPQQLRDVLLWRRLPPEGGRAAMDTYMFVVGAELLVLHGDDVHL